MEPFAPHSLEGRRPCDYHIVIPTLGRWMPACEVSPSENSLKGVQEPFILERTLKFLARHAIPRERVTLFVADEEEAAHYVQALLGSPWEDTSVVVGVRGIMNQRNFIMKHFPPGAFIVSMDDDVQDVLWKSASGKVTLQPLPPKTFQNLIYDAFQRLSSNDAFLCGLNTSSNPLSMHVDGISQKNGLVCGYLCPGCLLACLISRFMFSLAA